MKALTTVLLCANALLSAASNSQTGYDNTGAALVTGPFGLQTVAAYEFRDNCTLRHNGMTCYVIKVVLAQPLNAGWPPDLHDELAVTVWGDERGHMHWQAGPWTLELICADETVRQQIAWEGARQTNRAAGVQTVAVTIGIDTITLSVEAHGGR